MDQILTIDAYCDSDWAGDHDDRKSRSGYIIRINGSIISYKSKKQPVVANSSTEAEYIAGNDLD